MLARTVRKVALAVAAVTVVALAWCLPRNTDAPAQMPMSKTAPAAAQETFGYTQAFETELKKVGQISTQQFAALYPIKGEYHNGLTWDPTTAKFWSDFQLDPAKIPKINPKTKKYNGKYDFRLDPKELAAFKKNGFVVSERMGSASFGDMFLRIYGRDLPVYISADAVLHAWHFSYDAMLADLEKGYLAPSLADMLAGMAAKLPEAQQEYGTGVLADSLTDADYFLAVAQSLLQGTPAKSYLKQDGRVAKTLAKVQAEGAEKFNLFGRLRDVDFSQFKVRGHYETSEQLKRYFKAMMWCGRMDLRIAGGNPANGTESSPRELGAALVLLDLVQKSGKYEQWRQFEQLLQTFVGNTDSATFSHLKGLAVKTGITSPVQIKSLKMLEAIQKDILAGKIGLQHIRGDIVETSPYGVEKAVLPRSFTLLGQKFVLDSWVTAKVVVDDVLWDGEKVHRRIPSGLDVAFSVFSNNQTVPLLVQRINNPAGKTFRDGLNYQHNLAALRNIVDAQNPKVWDENIYMNWLATLRELSKPTTDAKYPEVMRTQPWAMKTLNTQLASWTQLRHDTILYAKQSYTASVSCFYPAGYVEPLPHFWEQMEKMANRSATLIEKTPFGSAQPLQLMQVKFLRDFAKQVAVLRSIADKELAQKELAANEVKFLKDTMLVDHGCGGPPEFYGWYPGLFYGERKGCVRWDALVADVHTDVPSVVPPDPGCVLHQGVGNVDLLVIAIDNGKDKMVYAGPVLSHYEFEMPAFQRKADSQWRTDINAGKLPPRPDWTASYLVPGVNPEAKNYKYEPKEKS